MKKLYLLLLLQFILLIPVFSQTTSSNVPDPSSIDASYIGGDWGTGSTWHNGIVPTSGVAEVLLGHTVTIGTGNATFDGVLVVYGTLRIIGKLTMTSTSMIVLAKGSKLTSGDGLQNGQNDKITIGSSTISDSEIDAIDENGNILTQGTLGTGFKDGCKEDGNCNTYPYPWGPIALPVELLYFRSTATNQGIQLEWASAKEWNFSHYTVERSSDGKEFTPIHTEYVDGDSYSTKTYSFLDVQPQFGANYYRLKATDIDATEAYKGMALAYAGIKGNLEVYPNPAKGGMVTFKNPGAMEGTWLSITGTSGREMMRIQMPEKELRLPHTALPAGIYIIKVWNQLEVKQARLVIQ